MVKSQSTTPFATLRNRIPALLLASTWTTTSASVKILRPPPYAGDAYGFGAFPGQYGMAILSKHPIETAAIRSFQKFLWKDIPEALIPDGRDDRPKWYSDDERDAFHLSSKSHWDMPIRVDGKLIHLLTSHPTPPVFDGREDRNGRRNHGEIRLWADYIDLSKAHYLYDDNGLVGGLPGNARFIIMGDLNANPNDGNSYAGAAAKLLKHPLIDTSVTPRALVALKSPTVTTKGIPLKTPLISAPATYAPITPCPPNPAGASPKPKSSGQRSPIPSAPPITVWSLSTFAVSEIATPAPIQEPTLKRTKNQVELQWQALAGHAYQELNHPSRSSLT